MWSDWQEGDTANFGWVDLGRGLRNIGWSEIGDWRRFSTRDPRVQTDIYATALSDPAGFPDHPVAEQFNGAFFTLPSTWKQARSEFPRLLQVMEFGVDYGPIPGSSSGDPEEFAQYETHDDNLLVESHSPDIYFSYGTNGGGESSIQDGDGRWSLGVVVGAVAPPASVFPDTAWYPDGQWPGLGSVFAEGNHTSSTLTNHGATFPDASSAQDLFVSVRMTGAPPIAGNAEQAHFSISPPWITYRMPRWRYWIPRKPPLRLRQRDDNLFLNAGRIRNRSSRQTTNRLRSYD